MQTVLITGATDGIGRETARQLLSRGFRVLVHGCTLEKAQRVVAEFQRIQPKAAAEAVYADLARMPAVVAAAVSQVSGRYFIDCQPTSPAPTAQAVERAEALRRASENALRPWLPVTSTPAAG